MYALQLLPVNYAGLALILLGVAFMVAEAFLPSFGALGLGGVVAFTAGALILIDTDLPGFGIPVALVVPLALGSAVLMAATAGVALRTRRRAVTGDLVGKVGEVQHGAHGKWIRVHGENWQVRSAAPLASGQRVRVVARDGLVLDVEPANHYQKGAP
jgi:membrane-bound serine protease (ClpP class)